tara:strand:- start:83260 stop:83808 length:549 start_codon:yes stop_codon:yes gene_type:complete
MKKFTGLTDIKAINESVKVSKIEVIAGGLQTELKNIIESSLNITIDGELDDFLTKNIEIDGKSKLVENLVNYIEVISKENSKILLEKVRYQGLNNVENELLKEHLTPGEAKKHRFRVESLLDKKNIEASANQQAKSIRNGEKAYYRAIAAEQMIVDFPENKKDLKIIKDIFSFRAKQLGFRK